MKKSLTATVAALLLATQIGSPAMAYFRTNQLIEIEKLIADNKWVDLRRYVLANPELLEGTDALALQLQNFMQATNGIFAFVNFTPEMFPDLTLVDASAAIY